MIRWIGILGLLWSSLAFAGPVTPSTIKGKWVDEGGTKYWFTGSGTLKKIIDYDKERFEVVSMTFIGSEAEFVYYVPSTGYTVTIHVDAIDGSTMRTTWSNDHDASGIELMTR